RPLHAKRLRRSGEAQGPEASRLLGVGAARQLLLGAGLGLAPAPQIPLGLRRAARLEIALFRPIHPYSSSARAAANAAAPAHPLAGLSPRARDWRPTPCRDRERSRS